MTCNGCPELSGDPTPMGKGIPWHLLPPIYHKLSKEGGKDTPCSPLYSLRWYIPDTDWKFGRPQFLCNGDIIYDPTQGDPTTTWEPPPPIDGYEVDKDNPRLFHPLWKDCEHRWQGVQIGECSCLRIASACERQGRKPVTFEACSACVMQAS